MYTEEKIVVGIIGTLALGITVTIIVALTGLHIQTGQGEHTGFVTSTETNGLLFKTHRAFVKTDTQSSQEDAYCVVGEDVFAKLQELTLTRKQVTVKYIDWLSRGIVSCGVEPAGVIIGVR